jgi:hypothetical protein
MGNGAAGLPWLSSGTRKQESPGTETGDLNRAARRSPPGRRRSIAALALLLGALILWLALPRLVAATLLAMRDPIVERTDDGEQVSDAELLSLIASRELALSWVEDRETHAERATALAKLAFQQAPETAAQSARLKQAVDALRAALALAPADPRGWTQLAYLLVLLEGDTSRRAAQALLVSIRTGAFLAPDFLNRRLFWSLAHWSFYDDEERRQIGDQIRLVWRITPGELTELAREMPDFFAPIAAALDEEAREQFLSATDATSIALPPPSSARFVTLRRLCSTGSDSFRASASAQCVAHRGDYRLSTGSQPMKYPLPLSFSRSSSALISDHCSSFVVDCSGL